MDINLLAAKAKKLVTFVSLLVAIWSQAPHLPLQLRLIITFNEVRKEREKKEGNKGVDTYKNLW